MKTFMKNWRPNRMKQFWLHSLLRTYSWVMIVIIASFALLISYVNWDSREKEARQVSQRVLTRTVSEVEYYYRESARSAQGLVDNQARIEGIYKYFSLSTPDYFYWQLERKASPYISVSIYENIDDLYVRNDFVTGVAIVLQDSTEVYVSTRDNRSGYKVSADAFKPDANSFAVPVSDPVSDQALGVIYVSVSSDVFYKAIDNTRGNIPIAVSITSPFETEMFHQGEKSDREEWLQDETAHGYQVQVAVPRGYVLSGSISSSVFILTLSLLFIVILYVTLKKTFSKYQTQVVDLVETIHDIAQGEQGKRIDLTKKDQELLLIAETTNNMLDRLERNIHDIYQLELSQKDANMRALQAQINPHFMYNTLEFLRMYAVMENQNELADIIYEFSSLLRNNISDERETTLKQEVEFCRKYSYLCMVRYPKSIAYGFKIDPGLEEMRIPKFTLQPLVENYFAHGVDHRRTDNVISIKALKKEGYVEILVTDNGRGMPAEKLAEIQDKLAQRIFEHTVDYSGKRQSIGIVNVHERFVLYFGDRYDISVESVEKEGVRYRITIQNEEKG
jgi:sensor histidine kinase